MQVTFSQVGINTNNPQTTLDVAASISTNTKDGILPPRITKQDLAAKDAGVYGISQTGAIIYVTSTKTPIGKTPSLAQVNNVRAIGHYYFNGSEWIPYTSTNIYTSDGTLLSNRIVKQETYTLAFTSTSKNGFSIDGTTFSVDAENHRIGLGTVSPETKLHVISTVPNSNRFNLIDATSGTNQYGIVALRNTSPLATGNTSLLGFTNSGPTSGGANWAIGSVRTGSTLTNGSEEDFYIANSTGGGLIERMRINPITGNIGIGTSFATSKLHINATNPLRLEGLQAASGTAGSLTINNTGVVQLRNASNISAAKGTGIVTITLNNTFNNTSVSSKTFDNLNEMLGNTFTAASTGLYKVDFLVNYPQRDITEDDGDGYMGYAQISLNGIQQAFTSTKVSVPEKNGAPTFVSCTNSTIIKMNAGQVLSFQALSFGSTPNSTNIVAPFTISVVRID